MGRTKQTQRRKNKNKQLEGQDAASSKVEGHLRGTADGGVNRAGKQKGRKKNRNRGRNRRDRNGQNNDKPLFKFSNGQLEILDQLSMPTEFVYLPVRGVEDAWKVINEKQVQDGSTIANVGSLSLALDVRGSTFSDKNVLLQEVEKKLKYLASAGPTAVNIKTVAEDLVAEASKLCSDDSVTVDEMKKRFLSRIEGSLGHSESKDQANEDSCEPQTVDPEEKSE